MKQLRFKDIEDFCDDPKLNGEVIATLHPEQGRGYSLSLNSSDEIRQVVSSRNRSIYFTSVEVALGELVDVPNLSRRIIIDFSGICSAAF